jgi:hypothetical protein
LYCGVIGHEQRNCDLPAAIRRKRYAASLGVQPTHPEDPRKWYLPESAGENGRALHMDLPWRNVAALGSRLSTKPKEHLAIVASVAASVKKMLVKEGEEDRDKNSSNTLTKNTMTSTTENTEDQGSAADNTPEDNTKTDENPKVSSEPANTVGIDTNTKKKGWKRIQREDTGDENKEKTQVSATDATNEMGTAGGGRALGKRGNLGAISLNQEDITADNKKKARGGSLIEPGERGSKEATSPGATGQLTGAADGACQEK